MVIGGRSNAALRRTGRFAEGWLGAWCSTRRFTEAREIVAAEADAAGRGDVDWMHGMQVWVGVGADRAEGAARAKARMEAFYKIPFEAFERYTKVGTPEDIADQLSSYRDVGCKIFNITPCAESPEVAIDAVGRIGEALRLG